MENGASTFRLPKEKLTSRNSRKGGPDPASGEGGSFLPGPGILKALGNRPYVLDHIRIKRVELHDEPANSPRHPAGGRFIELRLDKHHPDSLLAGLVHRGPKLPRGWVAPIDLHGALLEVIVIGEVAECRVIDQEDPVAIIEKQIVHFGVEHLQLIDQSPGIGPDVRSLVGKQLAQMTGHLIDLNSQSLGAEPVVGVGVIDPKGGPGHLPIDLLMMVVIPMTVLLKVAQTDLGAEIHHLQPGCATLKALSESGLIGEADLEKQGGAPQGPHMAGGGAEGFMIAPGWDEEGHLNAIPCQALDQPGVGGNGNHHNGCLLLLPMEERGSKKQSNNQRQTKGRNEHKCILPGKKAFFNDEKPAQALSAAGVFDPFVFDLNSRSRHFIMINSDNPFSFTMKKTVACIALISIAGVASVTAQPYLQAGVGYFAPETKVTIPEIISGGSITGIEKDIGFVINGGYKIPYNGLRVGVEFQYIEAKAEVGNILSNSGASMQAAGIALGDGIYSARSDYEFYTFLGTFSYDVLDSMDTRFRLTGGAGAGMTILIQDAVIRGPGGEISDSTDAFLMTLQGELGMGWALTDNLTIDLIYKATWYDNTNSSIFQTSTPYRSTSTQSITAAVTVLF